MSNIENDSDYEQVFIINETEDSFVSQSPRVTSSISNDDDVYYEPNSRDKEVVKASIGGFLVFVSVFVAILLFVMFVAPHIKLNSNAVGRVSFALFLLWLLYILTLPSSSSDLALIAKKKKNAISSSSLIKSKKGKINTIQERKAHQAAVDNQRLSNLTESQRVDEKRNKNIDIAIKALVSLGFKAKRATHLVSIALDEGIPAEETQTLIRHALNNNNKV
jgi:hypothetical protein